MLNDMLAKMASKLGAPKSDDMEREDTAPDPNGEDNPIDKRYKAGAVISSLRPKLIEALRKKDPKKFDSFMEQYNTILKDQTSLVRQGKWEEGKKKLMEAQDFAQKSDLETYLSPDEIKKTLDNDYDAFLKATIDMGLAQNPEEKSKTLVGSKEQGKVGGLGDIKFGRRFATMLAPTGIAGEGYRKTFKYDPSKKTVELDTENTFILDDAKKRMKELGLSNLDDLIKMDVSGNKPMMLAGERE